MSDDDLRRQNELLGEQVKLLVKTEKRLYSAQRTIERQLRRIDLLNRLALDATRALRHREVLERALEALLSVLRVDQGIAFVGDGLGNLVPAALRAASGFEVAPTAQPGVAAVGDVPLTRPHVFLDDPEDAAVLGLTTAAQRAFDAAADAELAAIQLVLPLRRRSGQLLGAIVLRTIETATALDEQLPSEADLPFLELVCAHIEVALENVLLQEELSAAAAELEQKVVLRTRDLERAREQADAARRAAEDLAARIEQREARLAARNQDMRLVLDNIEQGLLTLDVDARLADERSAIVDRWFGAPVAGERIWEFLGRTDPRAAEWLRVGWESLREGILPLEVCLAQLPARVRHGERTYSLAYRPVPPREGWTKMILVLSDVTPQLEAERLEQGQREVTAIFRRLISDRVGFESFFDEGSRIVRRLVRGEHVDLGALRRDLHTLKGNTALFGLSNLSTLCHDLESRLEENPTPLDDGERNAIATSWKAVEDTQALFRAPGGARIEIDEPEYVELLEAVRLGETTTELEARIVALRHEPVARSLERLAEQARLVAVRLGKGEIVAQVLPTNLRLPRRPWDAFWAALTHVVRNAVDHGLEPPIDRRAVGKADRGLIVFGARREGGEIVVTVEDDGRGVDWDAVAERARSLGLPARSPLDLVEALFREGVSTKATVTDISGRGLGMGAVRDIVTRLGGRVVFESVPKRGTAVRFVFPADALPDEEGAQGILPVRPDSAAWALANKTRRAKA